MGARPVTGVTAWSQVARALAGRVAGLRVTDADGRPAWDGDDLDPVAVAAGARDPGVVTHRLDDGLLTGSAGIALALAACARLPAPEGRRDDRAAQWASLAREAASASVLGATARGPAGPLGWDRGALGIARAASVVARLTGDADLAASARGLAGMAVDAVADGAELPPWPDLLGGLAGVLAGVCAVDLQPGARHEKAVRVLVGRLDALAVEDAAGARWPMAGSGEPVAGLAHGAAGIALALRRAALVLERAGPRLRAVTGGDPATVAARARRLAAAGVRWEEGLAEPVTGGWPDLRVDPPVPGLAWCHGAPGIGVCAALTATAEPGSRAAGHAHATYLRAAAAARWHRAAGADFDGTLCHGLAGVVEQHLLAGAAWPDAAAEHLRLARTVARPLVEDDTEGRPRWCCGVPGGWTPSLLTGLAGVALTLARCHDPRIAPSGADPTLGWTP